MSQSDNQDSRIKGIRTGDDAYRTYNPSLKQSNPDLSIETVLFVDPNELFCVNFCEQCYGDYLKAVKSTKDYGFHITNSKCKSKTLWCRLCKRKYYCKDRKFLHYYYHYYVSVYKYLITLNVIKYLYTDT